jgi:hypothetical protein
VAEENPAPVQTAPIASLNGCNRKHMLLLVLVFGVTTGLVGACWTYVWATTSGNNGDIRELDRAVSRLMAYQESTKELKEDLDAIRRDVHNTAMVQAKLLAQIAAMDMKIDKEIERSMKVDAELGRHSPWHAPKPNPDH